MQAGRHDADRKPRRTLAEMMMMCIYYICARLKLEGETENMGVCTKERKGVTAAVLMATNLQNAFPERDGGFY